MADSKGRPPWGGGIWCFSKQPNARRFDVRRHAFYPLIVDVFGGEQMTRPSIRTAVEIAAFIVMVTAMAAVSLVSFLFLAVMLGGG
jgi:hypothetical protein